MGWRWSNLLRHRIQNIFEDAGAGRKGECRGQIEEVSS
jgi:hypothetical protein